MHCNYLMCCHFVVSVNAVEADQAVSISLSNESEFILTDGQSPSSLMCDPQTADLLQNGTMNIGVNMLDTGIYQCLSSPNRTATAYLYVIVACKCSMFSMTSS